MQPNLNVEPLVREAFEASLDRDPHRSSTALQAIAAGGDQLVRDSTSLAAMIAGQALLDRFGGETPDQEDLDDLVKMIVRMEGWAGIAPAEVRSLLRALSGETDRPTLPPETHLRLVVIVGAWMLAVFRPMDRGWTLYLDQILTRLEVGAGR